MNELFYPFLIFKLQTSGFILSELIFRNFRVLRALPRHNPNCPFMDDGRSLRHIFLKLVSMTLSLMINSNSLDMQESSKLFLIGGLDIRGLGAHGVVDDGFVCKQMVS